ncbi:hypothetical protein FSP39_003903 [Pinctada imbricata]|uniref:Reverse transcriptase domain-containing protein n=1 Tax=Pinctada imbricata TaxID=66713 RepID=A0AA88XPS7_PINIB|nr:hypothetical protein FSP39_003903 [Pinctada imbricata]
MRHTIVLETCKTKETQNLTDISGNIDTNEISHTDPDGVAEAFANHFENIYTPSNDNLFDNSFQKCIEERFIEIFSLNKERPSNVPGGDIDVNEIDKIVHNLKYRKAPGEDAITNEHIRYGGKIVLNFLVKERFPNLQQQSFQSGLGCITASFNLQETISHYLELGSNVYVSFLDTSQAFDTVWRHGLLVKLHGLGIQGKFWSIINECHTDTNSAIIVNQKQSRWFPVLQGVRQGGVLSSLLYLVYIDELIVLLEACCWNAGI